MGKIADPLFSAIGDFGRWQFLVALLSVHSSMEYLWQTMANKFLTEEVLFNCTSFPALNSSLISQDQCNIDSVTCSKWVYDETLSKNSVTARFDLVCSKSYMTQVAQTLFFCGSLIGASLAGPIGDRFGRKVLGLGSMTVLGILTLIEVFSPVPSMWMIIRLFDGILINAAFSTIKVYLGENIGGSYRAVASIYAGSLPSNVSHILLGLTAYFVKDRLIIEYIMASFAFLITPMWFLLPESPRWLLAKAKNKEGITAVNRIIAMNKKQPLNEEDIEGLRSISGKHKDGVKHNNFFDLFKYPGIRRNLFILCLTWFSSLMGLIGFLYNTPAFGWNPYLVFIAPAVVNIPVMFVHPFLMNKFGRKVMYTCPMACAGLLTFITIVLPKSQTEIVTTFCILGAIMSNVTVTTGYVYTKEIFPTVLRSTGQSCVLVFGRIGAILVPIIAGLESISQVLPVAVYGGFLIVASVASIWLWPETTREKLSDTLEECEEKASGKNSWLQCRPFQSS